MSADVAQRPTSQASDEPPAEQAARQRQWPTMGAAPALVWLGARGFGLLAWWAMTPPDRALRLDVWDARWYLLIAQRGYWGADLAAPSDHHTITAAFGFFPGFPLLVEGLTPMCLGHPLVAAELVVGVSGVVFAYGLRRLAERVTASRQVGLVAVLLVAAAPMSVVFSLPYAEALFAALAVWALVMLLDERWLAAGTLTLLAGLVRPDGAALVAVVVVVALARSWRTGAFEPLFGAILAPLGIGGWWAVSSSMMGDPTGYLAAQQAEWHTHLDGGVTTVQSMWIVVTREQTVWPVLCVAASIGGVVAACLAARRLPTPAWFYGLLVMVLALGTAGIFYAKPRELLAAFVLAIPAAAWATRQSCPVVATVLGGWVLLGTWSSAYALTVWHMAV